MDKQVGDEEEDRQEQEQELQRLRKLVIEGLASGPPEPDTPADWAELRALASRDEARRTGEYVDADVVLEGLQRKLDTARAQLRAMTDESVAEFQAREDAAAKDVGRGGQTYTVDEVLDEMRAMSRARRRQLKGK